MIRTVNSKFKNKLIACFDPVLPVIANLRKRISLKCGFFCNVFIMYFEIVGFSDPGLQTLVFRP